MKLFRRIRVCMVFGLTLFGLILPLSQSANANSYPEREIRYILPWSAGGVSDSIARTLGQEIAKEGMLIVIEYMPGATGTLGLAKLASAKPDGYTIGTATSSQLAMVAQGLTKTSNDEFTYLNQTSVEYFILLVPSGSPVTTVEEFMAYAKKRDGNLSIGAAGTNNIPHILASNTAQSAGVPYIYTPYPGATKALIDLAGAQIDAVIAKPSESRALMDAGKIRAIGLYADKRLDILPDTPTFKEKGLDMFPDGPLTQMSYIVAPAGLPEEVTAKLVSAFERAIQSPAYKEFAEKNGFSATNVKGADLRAEVDAVQATIDRVAPKVFKAKEAK